jgi:hypothetical protein
MCKIDINKGNNKIKFHINQWSVFKDNVLVTDK